MKLSPISTCALFGGIASIYGLGIALMPVMTGLFQQDLSPLARDGKAAAVIVTHQGMAEELSWRMLGTSALSLVLFAIILFLDRKRSAMRS
jgi:hypothetical protein